MVQPLLNFGKGSSTSEGIPHCLTFGYNLLEINVPNMQAIIGLAVYSPSISTGPSTPIEFERKRSATFIYCNLKEALEVFDDFNKHNVHNLTITEKVVKKIWQLTKG